MPMPTDANGNTIRVLSRLRVERVAVTASSAAMATAFTAGTKVARLVCTVDVHWTMASSPTATTNHELLPAGVVEYIPVTAGLKLGLIRGSGATADGYATVSECV